MIDTIAVFDVGKTNKKIMIFDGQLKLLDRRYRHFESEVVDGVELEPMTAIREWLFATLKELSAEYTITSVAVATHGASVVTLDEDGNPACPVVSYTHTPEESFHDRFYAAVGSRSDLQRTTATAEIKPLVNPGKLLYFTREMWPEQFKNVARVLFFPQYFAYLLTGKFSVDYTYVGCHSYLWDFQKWDWSQVADELGIRDALPAEPMRSWATIGTVSAAASELTGIGTDVPVTAGIHDSNASLLPYLLKKRGEDFLLNSTGTWCVAMNPGKRGEGMPAEFAEEEIGKTVFFNISAFGTPVKTSILMGGQEFETYTDILKQIHSTDMLPDFNKSLYQRVLDQRQHFIIPGIVPGSGQFPTSRARVIDAGREYELEAIKDGTIVPPLFQDLPAAYAALNLSLAIQSKVALERVGITPGMAIFTEGGFRHNLDYNILVGAFLGDNPVYLTGIEEATSLGAAITAIAARDGEEPAAYESLFEIETFPVRSEAFRGLAEYEAAFLEHI
ncbi:MAG: FGGY family carbohydrate kinase [Alkalispirochaeta sp.]